MRKKDRDKRYIKNWRPLSLLNIDTKVLFKAISNKLKTILPTSISSQETAYVKNRLTGESGRLISDIIEISGWFNVTGFIVTMDIEKAFDSLDYSFLISALKKFSFGKKNYHLDRNLIKRSTIVCHKWWDNFPIFQLRKRHLPR